MAAVPDLPFPVPEALRGEVEGYADAEGKLPRAIERLGQVSGRDVVLWDGDGGWRARQLVALGARVTPMASGLRDESADAVVSFWSAFRPSTDGGASDAPAELAEADRILRPGGRLLAVHEYARDDLAVLLPPERSVPLLAWSRRDGWFLRHGFKIHVIHAFWTFPDLDRLKDTVSTLFGEEARRLLGDLHRPRLSWKIVVYHRLRGGAPG